MGSSRTRKTIAVISLGSALLCLVVASVAGFQVVAARDLDDFDYEATQTLYEVRFWFTQFVLYFGLAAVVSLVWPPRSGDKGSRQRGSPDSAEERLTRLTELLQSGVIAEEEYRRRRADVVNSL